MGMRMFFVGVHVGDNCIRWPYCFDQRSENMHSNVRISDIKTQEKPVGLDASQTLQRGLSLMDSILAAPAQGMRVAELCRQTGLERATVHRLLVTLQQMHYVTRIARFHYVPGPRWQRVPMVPPQRNELVSQLKPVLQQLSEKTGESAFAVVREGALSVCIARQEGVVPGLTPDIQVGTRQPLGVGAAGLALLSALSDRDRAAAIEMNDGALPLYRGMTPERLNQLVRATRERGWSVVGNHVTRNVLAVGLPVVEVSGDVVAGISVATSQDRLPKERQRQIVQILRQILRAHGYRSD